MSIDQRGSEPGCAVAGGPRTLDHASDELDQAAVLAEDIVLTSWINWAVREHHTRGVLEDACAGCTADSEDRAPVE